MNTAYLSKHNKKLQKTADKNQVTIYSWGLPARATCPNADACLSGCYGYRGHYLFKEPREKRERNYALSLSDEFVNVLTNEIQCLEIIYKNLIIRVHDTGDFYSEEYMDRWIEIAMACPTVVFYGYTKMITWYTSREERYEIPDNMEFIQSFGGKEDDKINMELPHAIVIENEGACPKGYTIANGDDLTFLSTDKIALVYHGQVKWDKSGFSKLFIRGTDME